MKHKARKQRPRRPVHSLESGTPFRRVYHFEILSTVGSAGACEVANGRDLLAGRAVTLYAWLPPEDEFRHHQAKLARLIREFPGVEIFSAKQRLWLAAENTKALPVLDRLAAKGLFVGFDFARSAPELPQQYTADAPTALPNSTVDRRLTLARSLVAAVLILAAVLSTIWIYGSRNNPDLPPDFTFTSSRRVIARGGSLTLFWAAAPSDKVILDPGGIKLPHLGELRQSPGVDTVYRLTVTGSGGTVSKQIAVKVH